jgi:hypothetical protein
MRYAHVSVVVWLQARLAPVARQFVSGMVSVAGFLLSRSSMTYQSMQRWIVQVHHHLRHLCGSPSREVAGEACMAGLLYVWGMRPGQLFVARCFIVLRWRRPCCRPPSSSRRRPPSLPRPLQARRCASHPRAASPGESHVLFCAWLPEALPSSVAVLPGPQCIGLGSCWGRLSRFVGGQDSSGRPTRAIVCTRSMCASACCLHWPVACLLCRAVMWTATRAHTVTH